MSTQILCAESYQRWIYWTRDSLHQVTPAEMAEIAERLYLGEISPNKEFVLITGTALKIPQPNLYLFYIEKAVKAANPVVSTKEDIIFCLKEAEKMRWGNDISATAKNYYYSYVYKSVRYINNYSGEGKRTDFLFVNGNPTIKCDCGNPTEVIGLVQNPVVLGEEEVSETPPPPKKDKASPPVSISISVVNTYPYYGQEEQPYRRGRDRVSTRKIRPIFYIVGIPVVVVGVGGLVCIIIKNSNRSVEPWVPGGAPKDE